MSPFNTKIGGLLSITFIKTSSFRERRKSIRLEEKIDNLENENKALRDLVQMQLAEMKKMLPKPAADSAGKSRKKPFWKFW